MIAGYCSVEWTRIGELAISVVNNWTLTTHRSLNGDHFLWDAVGEEAPCNRLFDSHEAAQEAAEAWALQQPERVPFDGAVYYPLVD